MNPVKTLRILLLIGGLPLFILGAKGEECSCGVAAQGADLTQTGPILLPDQDDGEWRELLKSLASKGSVFATFTEHRWFSFRHDPVVLTGEMRMSAENGLSLRYLKPEEKMMIVDEQGMVLRNARGRSRLMKSDPRSPNSGAALLRVMRFNLVDLMKDFEVRAVKQDSLWRFDFKPREEDLADGVGEIIVWGKGNEVTNLEMKPRKGPRIEIVINTARDHVVFTPNERQQYFR